MLQTQLCDVWKALNYNIASSTARQCHPGALHRHTDTDVKKGKKKEEHTQLNSYSIHSIGSKGASVFISIKLENSH